ncbi:hypothetical protein KAR52_02040 [Candidatus Pacearchaeota archaeon]|nr:hypothetical protein [Candidatus Pacearchaeota archaeon]
MKKRNLITIFIILAIITFSVVTIISQSNGVSKETTMCIANNATLYTQLGCHACEIQKEMFGKNYQYLSVIDCWFERDKCSVITHTPTWIIDGEKYIGKQSIEKLKELTGCN